MKTSNFANSASRRSPLSEVQWMGQTGKSNARQKTGGAVLLPLTSLIDAFSIIVIYLLVGTQGSGIEVDIPNQLKLPAAISGIAMDKKMPTVRIQNGQYFIDDKKVAESDLGRQLSKLKEQTQGEGVEILIQADTAMDYSDLDPLLKAGSQAGIQKLKFAVIPTK